MQDPRANDDRRATAAATDDQRGSTDDQRGSTDADEGGRATAAAADDRCESAADESRGATAAATDDGQEQLRVLNLVTNCEARFFKQQVDALEDYGVEFTTIALPEDLDPDSSRSILDYARIVPTTIRRSFGDYDLIHANNGLTTPAALAQPNLPVVTSLWGSDLLGQYGPIVRRCAKHSEEVIVMSPEMARGIDCDATVVPHGVDLERFSPQSRSAARAELGWAEDRHHVLFPYSPKREIKNYPRAERIVERVAQRLGEPVELQTVTGVSHAEMATYHNAADCLLLTSRREGSPNSVKEAMACGTPVVATPVGDVPERLADVDPSTVAEDDDGLVDGLCRVLRSEGRSNGREVAASELSVDATSERLYEIYRSVADRE